MIEVIPIPGKKAHPWLLKKHYARRVPPIKYAFAIVRDEEIQGVVTYGPPASPQVAKSSVGEENRLLVIELNRLCVETDINNAASILVGHSLRLLPAGLIVVSYADTKMGHVGYIYQATNFKYCGAARAHDSEYIVNGAAVHPRTLASQGITSPVKWAKDNNIKTRGAMLKHKYVFFTGGKSDRKRLSKILKWKTLDKYPKSGAKVRYDSGPKLHRFELSAMDSVPKSTQAELFAGLT